MDSGIRIIENAISDCDELVEWMEGSDGWHRSMTAGNEINEARTSETLVLPFLGWNLNPLLENMNRRVWNELDDYARSFSTQFYGVENPSVQRYGVGQFYLAHTDFYPSSDRVISAIAYLNDVEQGGETYFPNQDLSVEPIKGRLVIFPSNFMYRHEARPPTRGIKYAAAFWARGG